MDSLPFIITTEAKMIGAGAAELPIWRRGARECRITGTPVYVALCLLLDNNDQPAVGWTESRTQTGTRLHTHKG